LSTAFGLGAGVAPDHFMVSLAVFGLVFVVVEESNGASTGSFGRFRPSRTGCS
jgi:hypothetical protein